MIAGSNLYLVPRLTLRRALVLLASQQFRDDIDEEDLDDRHAGKDHCITKIGSIRGCQSVRIGQNRRITTSACNNSRHLVVRHSVDKQADNYDRQNESNEHESAIP